MVTPGCGNQIKTTALDFSCKCVLFSLHLTGPCQTSCPPRPPTQPCVLRLGLSHSFFSFSNLCLLSERFKSAEQPAGGYRAPLSINSDANVRQCLDEESSPPSTIAGVILVTIASIVLVTPVWINRVCLIETVGCDNGTGRSPDSTLWRLCGGLYVWMPVCYYHVTLKETETLLNILFMCRCLFLKAYMNITCQKSQLFVFIALI